ncbi:HisA/HisF-related TIM barrel protein [Streptomyces sp. NPDC051582]|uniref:HisA/HisF-related TIM barrel protein n=1 Tax=Streptomyces sp. NPDC051582 TaxID=3155167 RepID=UPI003438ED2F
MPGNAAGPWSPECRRVRACAVRSVDPEVRISGSQAGQRAAPQGRRNFHEDHRHPGAVRRRFASIPAAQARLRALAEASRRKPPRAGGPASPWSQRTDRPELVRCRHRRHGERLGVSLPVRTASRGPRLAGPGGTDAGSLWDAITVLDGAGCPRCVVTDVGREGTLAGPNTGLFTQVCARTATAVLAAGGIASLHDLRTVAGLASYGVQGVLVGRALYAGTLTLAEALACVAATGPADPGDPTRPVPCAAGWPAGRRLPAPPGFPGGHHPLGAGSLYR